MAKIIKIEHTTVELGVTLTHDEAIALRRVVGRTTRSERYWWNATENALMDKVYSKITDELGGISKAYHMRVGE